MANLPDLISRARLETGDILTPFNGEYQGDDVTTTVVTPSKPVSATGLVVREGLDTLTLNSDYTVDIDSGTVQLTNPVPSGSVLTVIGSAYNFFSDTDWTTFFTSAMDQHLLNRADELQQPILLDNLPDVEEYPLAILGIIQALYALVNDASFDIDISTPEGIHIPKGQRVEQLWRMIAGRTSQYTSICSALNVGLWSIETLDLRRKSLMTGRFVPIYETQEFEDTRFPRRLFVPITSDMLAPEPAVQFEQVIDLTAYSNQDFTTTVTLGYSVAGYQVAAGVRRYPASYVPLVYMTTEVLDVDTGEIRISVNGRLNYYIGVSKFWDLQLIDASGNVSTRVGGTYDAIRQGMPGLGFNIIQ